MKRRTFDVIVSGFLTAVVFWCLIGLLVLSTGCVTRKELATPAMEHMISDCAVLAMCERDEKCAAVTFDGIPLTEFQAEQCKQAEIIADTVKGQRTQPEAAP